MCDQAVVERILADDSVSSIKISANLQSDNYDGGVIAVDSGTVGWRIERNTGDAVFNDVVVRGALIAGTGSSIDGVHIVSGTVDTLQLADAAVEEAKINNLAVTTGKIDDLAVTDAKIASLDVDKLNTGTLSANVTITSDLTLSTGGVFRTATSGRRIQISDTSSDRIEFYDTSGSPGFLAVTTGEFELRTPSIISNSGSIRWDGTDMFFDAGAGAIADYVFGGSAASEAARVVANFGTGGNPEFLFGTSGAAKLRYEPVGTLMRFYTNSTERFRIDTGQWLGNFGTAGAPTFSFISDADTGIYRSGINHLSIAAGGVARFTVEDDRITSTLVFRGADGSPTAPGYSFSSDTDIGMYRVGPNNLAFSVNGARVFDIVAAQMRAVNGTVSVPAYSFISDVDTGIYWPGTSNQIAIAVGGVQEFLLGNAGAFIQNAYDSTTASAANMFVDSAGRLFRSTSLEDYKEEIEPWSRNGSVLDLEPITFYPTAGNPSKGEPLKRFGDRRLLSLGARQAADVDPFFVTLDGEAPDWNAITAALVAEVRALTDALGDALQRIDNLESRLAAA